MTESPSKKAFPEFADSESAFDWTDLFDRHAIARKANELIDELILEIHGQRLNIHRGLDVQELALLYRFPIHVGVNIFVERLLRVAHSQAINGTSIYPAVFWSPRYFADTDEAVVTHYLDFALNRSLLYRISNVLGGMTNAASNVPQAEQPRPQDALLKSPARVRDRAKALAQKLADSYVILTKPSVVGEYSNWMREFLPYHQMLRFDFPLRPYEANCIVRDAIKDCCHNILERRIDGFPVKLDETQRHALADIFADVIDHILPQSIVEGLTARFIRYENVIKNWNIKQVHSFIGYYYKENFKVFAILARRKGALLLGHAHGASNPTCTYKQSRNELAFLDVYFTWGKKSADWMKGDLGRDDLKMVNAGSTYLSTIKKWDKRRIDPESLSLLFPSGPLMNFMADLQETTPDRSYQDRLNVLHFLKEIWKIYPKLRVLYKAFPGTCDKDPVMSLLDEELQRGALQLFQERPSLFFNSVDVVLWDSISTGFCEALSSGVPTLVFQSRSEYDLASPVGKKLNNGLKACGMLCHDSASAVECFRRIVTDLPGFLQSRQGAVRNFQEVTACPVGNPDFNRMLKTTVPASSGDL